MTSESSTDIVGGFTKTLRCRQVVRPKKKPVQDKHNRGGFGRPETEEERRSSVRREEDRQLRKLKRNGSRGPKLSKRQKKPKNGHVCGPYDLSQHHREPKIRGGSPSKSNILIVYRYLHDAWHDVYGVMSVSEVVKRFRKLATLLGFNPNLPRTQARKVKRFIGSCEEKAKIVKGWYTLYGGMMVEGAIVETNRWIPKSVKLVSKSSVILVAIKATHK